MARKFSELRAKMSVESQARSKAQADAMLQDMALAELRRAHQLTQEKLAISLKVNQAWISKVERQTDMYLSTLRAYVKGMGGELEIIARFDDCQVRINHVNEPEPDEQGPGLPEEPILEVRGTTARENVNTRIAVWTPPSIETTAADAATHHPQIWNHSDTGRSRTPSADTSSPTSKAA